MEPAQIVQSTSYLKPHTWTINIRVDEMVNLLSSPSPIQTFENYSLDFQDLFWISTAVALSVILSTNIPKFKWANSRVTHAAIDGNAKKPPSSNWRSEEKHCSQHKTCSFISDYALRCKIKGSFWPFHCTGTVQSLRGGGVLSSAWSLTLLV